MEEDAQPNQRHGSTGEDEEERQLGERKRPREQRGLGQRRQGESDHSARLTPVFPPPPTITTTTAAAVRAFS